jgi:capsular exopolysaccharide synthesis family protein
LGYESDPPRLQGTVTKGHASHGTVAEVQQYIDALRRRWWVIVAATLLAVGVAWWGERDRVPTYTAEVLLEQWREEPLVGSARGGSGPDVASQIEVIRSRAVVGTVVDSLGLRMVLGERAPERSRLLAGVEFGPDAEAGAYTLELDGNQLALRATGTVDAISTAPMDDWIEGPGFRLRIRDPSRLEGEPMFLRVQGRQDAVERLQGRLRVEMGRGPGLVRIAYTDPDPVVAAAVVNGMAAAYQVQRAAGARQAATRRREAIATQLVDLADSLATAQAEVVEYQRSSRLLDPQQEGGQMMSSVFQLENELRTLRFQEGLLSSLVAGLRSEDGGDESLSQILSLGSDLVPAGPALHRRLEELQMERSRLTASTFGRTARDPEVQVLDSLIATTKAQMRTAAEQGLDHIRTRTRGAEEQLAQMRREMDVIPGQSAELARLRQRAGAVQDIVDALVDRYYEAQVAEAVEAGDVAVIDPAPVPLWPDASRTTLVLMAGLIGGLMVGMLGALVLEYFDLRVRRAADAEEVTGLPLVGMVPRMGRLPSHDPVAAAIGKEAFRSLRTNLRFAHQTVPRVMSVTSATPKEGKTTISLNLAASLAEQEGREPVLIVDADLRRPQVHRSFGMSRSPGLTELLQGKAELEDVIRPSPHHSNLQVLTSGGAVTNPSEIISGRGFTELMDTLGQHFGFVVVDTPPLLAVSDGAAIAKATDGTLIVVRADQADRGAVAHAMEQLRHIDADLLGVILNAVDTRQGDGRYSYAYYDEYLAEVPEEPGGGSGWDQRRLIPGSVTGAS